MAEGSPTPWRVRYGFTSRIALPVFGDLIQPRWRRRRRPASPIVLPPRERV